MAKKPETLFKERVYDDLDTLDKCWYEKIQQKSIRGTPDIIACINGYFVAIELKVDSPIEPLQTYKLNKIKSAKGVAITATPATWKNIFLGLQVLSKERR